MKNAAMIDRYSWWEILLIYRGVLVFLTFVLAPFVEGFLVSLKPLSQLFSSPYRFWPENGSFEAYRTMWISVPGFGRYIFNSFFISIIVTVIVLALVIPASYAFARFDYPGRTAGPTFELFYGVDYLLPHREAAWAVMEERMRVLAELATRCREVCSALYLPLVARVADDLVRLADQLAEGR